MTDDRKPTGGRAIDTGGGAYVEGSVSTGGGDFVGRDQTKNIGAGAAEAAELFEKLFAAIEKNPKLSQEEKADVKAEVEEVKAEAEKGEEASESFLTRRLRSIGRMAPDILEVVLATIGNPAAGLGLVAKKVADKMKGAEAGPAAGG